MTKRVIATVNAPAAVGAYVQAIEANGTLYVSGQIPLVPSTMEIADGGIEGQTRQALENLFAIVEEAGYKKTDIVKCMCLLANVSDFAAFNAVYEQMMDGHKPARAAFGGNQIPKGALVEIDAIAVK